MLLLGVFLSAARFSVMIIFHFNSTKALCHIIKKPLVICHECSIISTSQPISIHVCTASNVMGYYNDVSCACPCTLLWLFSPRLGHSREPIEPEGRQTVKNNIDNHISSVTPWVRSLDAQEVLQSRIGIKDRKVEAVTRGSGVLDVSTDRLDIRHLGPRYSPHVE